MTSEPSAINRFSRSLFAPIAADYETWSRVLSLGQDPRWRRRMVARLDPAPDDLVLDAACGTGEVTRLLRARGCRVVSLDLSPAMLAQAARRGAWAVNARAEALPFADAAFAHLSFTYLLRYVDDPLACLRELARVVRPGGRVGMVEFGLPRGVWRPLWNLYVDAILPAAGGLVSGGWRDVGAFLGDSIRNFHAAWPGRGLPDLWEAAGIRVLGIERMSLGGGLVMWGVRQ